MSPYYIVSLNISTSPCFSLFLCWIRVSSTIYIQEYLYKMCKCIMLIIFVSDVFDLILVTGKTVFTEQKLPQTNHLYKECEYKKNPEFKAWLMARNGQHDNVFHSMIT